MSPALRPNASGTPRTNPPAETTILNNHADLLDATNELGYAVGTDDLAVTTTPTTLLSIDIEPWERAVMVYLEIAGMEVISGAGTLGLLITNDDDDVILKANLGSYLDLVGVGLADTWAPTIHLSHRLLPVDDIQHVRVDVFSNANDIFVIRGVSSTLPTPYTLQAIGL